MLNEHKNLSGPFGTYEMYFKHEFFYFKEIKSMVTKINEIQYSVEYILDAKEIGIETGDKR